MQDHRCCIYVCQHYNGEKHWPSVTEHCSCAHTQALAITQIPAPRTENYVTHFLNFNNSTKQHENPCSLASTVKNKLQSALTMVNGLRMSGMWLPSVVKASNPCERNCVMQCERCRCYLYWFYKRQLRPPKRHTLCTCLPVETRHRFRQMC